MIVKKYHNGNQHTHYDVICSGCKEAKHITRGSYNTAIRKHGRYACQKCVNTVTNKKRGPYISGLMAGKPKYKIRGKKHGNWKGGRHTSSGYKKVKIDNPDTGLATNKYTTEHKIVIENDIGRTLVQGELIHHIDGQRDNNDIDNLHLCSGHKEHKLIHGQLEKIAYTLVQNGVILFDKIQGIYYIDLTTLNLPVQ
jgi:hypothetical protein